MSQDDHSIVRCKSTPLSLVECADSDPDAGFGMPRRWLNENPELKSYADIEAAFNQLGPYYWGSDCRKVVHQILDERQPPGGWQIDLAVIFGTGILAERDKHSRSTSMLQLLAFMDIIDHVGTTSGKQIPMYAQDPAYGEYDKQLLNNYSIEVLQGSYTGQRLVNRRVFGFQAQVGIDEEVFDQYIHLQPSLWVGHNLKTIQHYNSRVWKTEEQWRADRQGHAGLRYYFGEYRFAGDDETLSPRQEQRRETLNRYAETNTAISFPELDAELEHPRPFYHGIDTLWAENSAAATAAEGEGGKSCARCDGGQRDEWRHPGDRHQLRLTIDGQPAAGDYVDPEVPEWVRNEAQRWS